MARGTVRRALPAIIFLVSLFAWADQPRRQYEFLSDNGRFVLISIHGSFRRVPLFEDRRFQRYVEVGSGEDETWGVFDAHRAEHVEDLHPGSMIAWNPIYTLRGNFASRSVFVGEDGNTVTVVDDFSERDPVGTLEVLHFFDEGRLTRAYTLGELLEDVRSIRPTVSHFLWLSDLRYAEPLLRLETTEGRQLEFDVGTGEILPAVSSGQHSTPLAHGTQSRLECDPGLLMHAPPEVPSWDSQAPFVTIYDWSDSRAAVPLGIGHVRRISAFWWGGGHVHVPLHEQPGTEPWGWFADGWLVETGPTAGEPAPIGLEGTVETEYEDTSFIVFESRNDGWLRLRYGRPSEDRDGTAWVHRCHLEQGSLAFETWQERFLSDEISPLYVRDRTPHSLLAAPDDDAEEVVQIHGDYHLEPLEVQGDWMRVRLKTPSDYCVEPDELRIEEGWIRWRSAARGPLVWYYTRGC